MYVSVSSVATRGPGARAARRLVACVDIRPGHLTPTRPGTLTILDVQPIGEPPPVPLAIDAVTGAPLPEETAELLDEHDTPCDRRLSARTSWDDNLRRAARRRAGARP